MKDSTNNLPNHSEVSNSSETTSNKTLASPIDPHTIYYQETISDNVCVVNIGNVQIKRPVIHDPTGSTHSKVVFDPLAKIWSTIRKRILDYWKLSIVGAFTYDETQEVITCTFFPETAAINQLGIKIGTQTYHGMFIDLFREWSSFFERHLEEWLTAEDGYAAYAAMIDSGELRPEKYRKYFNGYLKSRKLRTRADEVRSAKKRREGLAHSDDIDD